jgi:hypothetical protein
MCWVFDNSNDCLKFLESPQCYREEKHTKKLISHGTRSTGSQNLKETKLSRNTDNINILENESV